MELRARGGAVEVVPTDLTDETAVQQLAAHIGAVDVVVHSVGGAIVAPFSALSLAQWETSLRTLLTSAFLLTKYTAPQMPSGSLIVYVASVAARQAFPGWAAYSAAKHGLLGFANAVREELRPQGVRVTTVLPAATDTDLWHAVPGEWNRTNMLRADDVARAIASLLDQPPYVTVEDLVIGHTAGRL
ncbi:SDR family NAD(P)-dependent oxidoreductase [Candidatus Gracilibacteria bacterium]|nr:SDR family NAD(P)-dependent oxidoreductase [Candidatus Gracilibacteria bacterium]